MQFAPTLRADEMMVVGSLGFRYGIGCHIHVPNVVCYKDLRIFGSFNIWTITHIPCASTAWVFTCFGRYIYSSNLRCLTSAVNYGSWTEGFQNGGSWLRQMNSALTFMAFPVPCFGLHSAMGKWYLHRNDAMGLVDILHRYKTECQ